MIAAAVANRQGEPHWVAILVSGILSVGIGLLTFFLPNVTALALLLVIAAWAIITGIGEIAAAIRLRKLITGEWLLVLAGVLSVAFGVLLFVFPGAGGARRRVVDRSLRGGVRHRADRARLSPAELGQGPTGRSNPGHDLITRVHR